MNHLGEIRYLTALGAARQWRWSTTPALRISAKLGSREAIARAKGEIYAGLRPGGIALINADDDFAELWRELNAGRRMVDFGIERPATVSAQYELSGEATLMTVRTPQTQYRGAAAGAGRAQRAQCARRGRGRARAGHPHDLRRGRAVQLFAAPQAGCSASARASGATFIDDTYNANPDSVTAAIDVLRYRPANACWCWATWASSGEAGAQLHAEVGDARARGPASINCSPWATLSQAAARSFGRGRATSRTSTRCAQRLDQALDAGHHRAGEGFALHAHGAGGAALRRPASPQPAQGDH